jgi:hypothetical protein
MSSPFAKLTDYLHMPTLTSIHQWRVVRIIACVYISAKGAKNTNYLMAAVAGGLVESSDCTEPSRTDVYIGAPVQ